MIVEPGLYVTFSDADGRYALTGLPPGQYTFTAERSGYDRSAALPADLNRDASLRLDLSLPAHLPVSAVPLQIIAPPESSTVLRGEVVSLVLRAVLPAGTGADGEIVWTSDVEGGMGASALTEAGLSRLDVRFHRPGLHTVTAEWVTGGGVQGQAAARPDVREPVDLHAIGMAWDGSHLWLAVEPADTGEIGRLYRLAVQDGGLEVVTKFPPPSPAPGSVAWDGESIWTTAPEGPDPLRSWEGATGYLYRHASDGGLSVVERYPSTPGFSLSGDGRSLWASDAPTGRFSRLDNARVRPEIGAQYAAPSNQLRTVEWVNGHLWALDAAANHLYKFAWGPAGLTVEGECEPGAVSSYGMAWDGDGFWMFAGESRELKHVSLGPDCPRP